MNSSPPTPRRKPPHSKPTGSFKHAAGITALTVAVAIGGALLLFLPREPWKKAKTESAALLQKSNADSVRKEKNPALSGSRNDAEATVARAKSSESRNPPGLVALLAEPTAYTRLLVNDLCRFDQPSVPKTQEQAAEWKEHLQALVQQGRDAVPAIVEFLKQNKDLDFDPSTSEAIGYASARKAMFDALLRIGGLEGVSGMLQTLQTTADPREIALLAQDLEKLEPEQHRQVAITAAREALAMAAGGKLEAADVAPLFEVLHKYGDTSVVSELMQTAQQWNYYSAIALAKVPDGGGVPALIDMAQSSSIGRLSALQMLAQVSITYPEAHQALIDQARADKISPNLWPYLTPLLAGDQYHYQDSAFDAPPRESERAGNSAHVLFGNQHFFMAPEVANLTAEEINQRMALIDELQSVTSDPAALQALQRSRDLLTRRMPQTVAISQ